MDRILGVFNTVTNKGEHRAETSAVMSAPGQLEGNLVLCNISVHLYYS